MTEKKPCYESETESICDEVDCDFKWEECCFGKRSNRYQPKPTSESEIMKPCYEDPEYVNDCLEDGNRKCCHLGPPKNGSWEDCDCGKLSPYYQPPSEVQPMLADAGQWTDRLLALLERIATAQEKEAEAWVALKDSEKKRVEYARNAEAIRQHSIDKEADERAERNAFLDARNEAQHQAWLRVENSRSEWFARAAERGEREVAAFEKMVGLLEYLCDRKRDLE